MLRYVILLCLGIVCLAPLTSAQAPGQRQYYAAWNKHTTKNYYYRNYYFKKSADDEKYTYHYALYYPSRGKRIFMYNPHARKYWGAWEGDKYSLLSKDKQKASLDEIAADGNRVVIREKGDAHGVDVLAARRVFTSCGSWACR